MAAKKEKEKKEKPAHLIARAQTKFMEYTVKKDCELIDFLMKAKDGISRTSAKSLLSRRQVYVNHVITTQYNFPLKPGMKVQLSRDKGQKEFRSNYLKVLYEDAYLLVVDKKEGLPTVGTAKQKERTAHGILTEYVQRSGKNHRVYVVHRLDKEVSGLLIFAKDEKTKISIQDNWKDLIKEQRFVAILSGEIENDNGAVSSWMNEDGQVYVAHSLLPDNKNDKATTVYETIKRANNLSLIEVKSGRNNQIRFHMQDLKHPVIGDERFGDNNDPINRLGLHAFKLSFRHPVTGSPMSFETPYPPVFKKVMLRKAED